MKRNKRNWRICTILVLVLVLLGYTPLMIPHGIYKPMIFGIPYSLWTSILVTVALVVLTYMGSKVHPGSDEGEEEA
jgi:protein-S-isoprenylcysteine O-methyltransferase Ste14